MAACNGTTALYCSPPEGAVVMENQTYALDFNAQFETIDGEPVVDIFLYHADNPSLAANFTNVPNNGEMTFVVDQSWFTVPPATTTQLFPFQWYVVAKGETYNLPSSSATYGPIFTAERPAYINGTPVPTSTDVLTSNTSRPVASKSSLPAGAIAGIVACACVVIAAFIAALFCFRRRKNHSTQHRMKLDSDSDIDHTEKSVGGFALTPTRKSHESTDTTNFDVPLAFAAGSIPSTPTTINAVPIETSRMYVGPPPTAPPRAIIQQNSSDYGRPPAREMRQQNPNSQAPPSPKFPMQSNGNPSGWQSSPAQRSQNQVQGPPIIPDIRIQSVDIPPGFMREPPSSPSRKQFQPSRNEAGQYPSSRNEPGQPQPYRDQSGQPQQRRNDQGQYQTSRYEQGQYQSSRGRPGEPQSFRGRPEPPRKSPNQIQQVRGPPADQSQVPESQSRSVRDEQGQSQQTRIPMPSPQSQAPRPRKQVPQATQAAAAQAPPIQAAPVQAAPVQVAPVQPAAVEATLAQPQPESKLPRQNSRKGLIPPFPVDAVTRKPIANRTPTPEPAARESDSNISLDLDETPPPTKITPITPTAVSAVRAPEIQRDPSVKSVAGTIENIQNVSPPTTSQVAKKVNTPQPPKVNATPVSPTGNSFVREESSIKVIPPISVVPPPVSAAPPSPPAARVARPTKEKEPSGSVTADILRLSTAETVASSAHTSMVVESHSRVNSTVLEAQSRAASSIFEMPMERTPPLVIAKKEEVGNQKDVKEVEEKKETDEDEEDDDDDLEFSLPPTLPALERGSLFHFDGLT